MTLRKNLSAVKDNRQNQKRRLRNRMVYSRAKTLAKTFLTLVDEKKKEEAQKTFLELSAYLDRAVTHGMYHRNNAARKKSRMSRLLKTIGA
jgi:small subunit ribosomal protein S20